MPPYPPVSAQTCSSTSKSLARKVAHEESSPISSLQQLRFLKKVDEPNCRWRSVELPYEATPRSTLAISWGEKVR